MPDQGGIEKAVSKRARAGSQALTVLADPLTTWVLRAHEEGPLRFRELEEILGWAAQANLRSALGDLRDTGALAKRDVKAMPRSVANELTEAGRDPILVAETLERWLADSPGGSLVADTTAAKGAVKALTGGWDCGAVRVMAKEPTSLTKLSVAVDDFSYHMLERRLAKMRATGQIEPVDGCTKGVSYAVTDWLRHAIAPLTAAGRWERLHIPDSAPAVDRRDVEAAFLLTLPLIDLPDQLSGECSFAVLTPGSKAGSQSTAVARVSIEAGPSGIVFNPVDPEANPRTWALGPVEAWFEAIISGDHANLSLSVTVPNLPGSIEAALHTSLFAPSG